MDLKILFDELSQSIQTSTEGSLENTALKLSMHEQILTFFKDCIFNLIEEFIHNPEDDESPVSTSSNEVPTTLYHKLDPECILSIKFVPNSMRLHYFPALFRLAVAVSGAEEFSVCLGTAVMMNADLSLVSLNAREKKEIIDGLYHCVNWYR